MWYINPKGSMRTSWNINSDAKKELMSLWPFKSANKLDIKEKLINDCYTRLIMNKSRYIHVDLYLDTFLIGSKKLK